MIGEFGIISSYKVNKSKSVLSGFNISEQMKQALSEILPGKWQNEGMGYLGSRIGRSNAAMIEENIMPIITYMEDECRSWDTNVDCPG